MRLLHHYFRHGRSWCIELVVHTSDKDDKFIEKNKIHKSVVAVIKPRESRIFSFLLQQHVFGNKGYYNLADKSRIMSYRKSEVIHHGFLDWVLKFFGTRRIRLYQVRDPFYLEGSLTQIQELESQAKDFVRQFNNRLIPWIKQKNNLII